MLFARPQSQHGGRALIRLYNTLLLSSCRATWMNSDAQMQSRSLSRTTTAQPSRDVRRNHVDRGQDSTWHEQESGVSLGDRTLHSKFDATRALVVPDDRTCRPTTSLSGSIRMGRGHKAQGRDVKVQPSEASGGVPNPSAQYLNGSCVPAIPLQTPQHLLVVIDLNGTLLFRPSRAHPTRFTARPHTIRFLQYCIDTFTVVIWSSARLENVQNMCATILTPDMRKDVAAIWGRDKFGLSKKEFNLRVQCYKRLSLVWNDPIIARCHPDFINGGTWDQTNTVLVDDSLEKGRSEPYNLIKIPEFAGDLTEPGDVLPQVHDYLNCLSRHSNVSAFLRTFPFKTRARAHSLTDAPQINH